MKKISPLHPHLTLILTLILTLVACNSDVSKETSRTPKGNPNAAVVVQEFADLQCPACRATHSQISQPLLEKYGNTIAFHHMHFPLRSIHRYALEASEASECAADQGKFWDFVDIAFEKQPDLTEEALTDWAKELGLNMPQFNACVRGHKKRDTVLADYKEGRDKGVQGTPTFFVNGVRVDTSTDALNAAIDAELDRLTQQL